MQIRSEKKILVGRAGLLSDFNFLLQSRRHATVLRRKIRNHRCIMHRDERRALLHRW